MKKGERNKNYLVILIIVLIMIVPLISAGFFDDFWKQITGEATRTVGVNISVGVTRIAFVFNDTQGVKDIGTTLNVGPNPTSIIINFSVYQGANSSNINESTATINVSFSAGAQSRANTTCIRYETGANYKNFTCNVTMWWYDGSGTWLINASILDNFSLLATNTSTNFSVASLSGLEIGPVNLTYTSIGAGATNQTSNNDPLVLNNTGNQNVGTSISNISINSTDLVGETNGAYRLYSGNFSAHWATGGACSGATCTECAGSQMNIAPGNYANITNSNVTAGNFTINDGNTGQEQLYFCVRYAGSELTTQSYSTVSQGVWTIKI